MTPETILATLASVIPTWKATNANQSRKQVRGLAMTLRDDARSTFEHAPSVNMLTEVLIQEILTWQGVLTDTGAQRAFTETAERLHDYLKSFSRELASPLVGLPRDSASDLQSDQSRALRERFGLDHDL